MNDTDENEFERLLQQAVDDSLSPADAERLQELSRGNRQRLEQLVDHAMIASLLTEEGTTESVADLVDLLEGTDVDKNVSRYPVPSRRVQGTLTDRTGYSPLCDWKTIVPWGVAVMFALAFLVNYFPPSSPELPTEADSFVGLLVDEAGAEFAKGFGPDDVKFDTGEFRLGSGAIHFRLANGADLVMRAPVTFRLHDVFNLELLNGGLRAVIPPSAEGFTVAAPEVNYEDLGTEFGVSVDRASGASKIHVFDGLVNAKDAKSNELLSPVTSGQTMRYTNDQWQQAEAPREDEFPVPGEIGFARWQDWRRDFIKDPSLIAFYSFTHNPDAPEYLVNDAGIATDGAIQGARWVSGRWPGKDALLFDRDNDYVDLTISGEYDEITLSFWVKMDRLDYEYNALLNSNGWDPGDLHFQIKRTGLAWANFNGKMRSFPAFVGKPVKRDSWQHIVGLISRTDQMTRTYINGEMVWEQKSQQENPMMPDKCSLGNWLDIPEQYQPTRRAFKGRMDEVAIWSRALSETEINAHYEAGRPSLLDK